LAAGITCTAVVSPEPARAANTTFYGVDNDNNIWEVDPIQKFNVLINEVGRTIPNCDTTDGCLNVSSGSNGIAFDTGRNHLFFFYNNSGTGAAQPWDLRFWNRKSFGPSSLSIVPWASGTNIPANAAYYDNALWYFDGGTTTRSLNKLSLQYNADQDQILSTSLNTYDLSGFTEPTYPSGGYGDIAINVLTGFLYGSQVSGNYYKIDLNQLGNPEANIYESLGAAQTLDETGTGFVASGLQLSFNADYTKLYGTRFCNAASNCSGYDSPTFTAQAGDGLFFEVMNFDDYQEFRQFGSDSLLFSSSPGYRDLGGATANAIVPGPLPILGIGGAFGWSRRIRRKISSIKASKAA
jgi:hypothetical protein